MQIQLQPNDVAADDVMATRKKRTELAKNYHLSCGENQ